jgi:membrane dipeptidase
VRDWYAEASAAAVAAGVEPGSDAEDAFVATYREDHAAPSATLDDVVAHVEHVREVAGVEHIGLGGDYDGVDRLPVGLEDVSGYPRLLAALADRGWSDEDLAGLTCRNVLRTMRDAGLTSARERAEA